MNQFFVNLMQGVIFLMSDLLMPLMVLMLVVGVATRMLVYYTVKREEWFVFEFEKRLVKHLDHEILNGPRSFYATLKRTLERTFYEIFEVRSVMRRRRIDHIMTPADRLFLIQSGCAYLVRDSLKAARGLRKTEVKEEKNEMLDISRNTLSNNPCFSKVLGLAPISTVNDFLNQLPGLFIVVGILGTFLGIMKGLPELGDMDVNNAAATKEAMDLFLVKVAHSMGASAFGIINSILTQVLFSFLNPERVFMEVVEKYENLLNLLWRRSDNNEMPAEGEQFDEHRDPVEALAALSLQKELTASDQKKAGRVTRGNPQPTGKTGFHQAPTGFHQAPPHGQYPGQPQNPQYPQQHPQQGYPQQQQQGYPPHPQQQYPQNPQMPPQYGQQPQNPPYGQQPAAPQTPAGQTPPRAPTDPNKKVA